MNREDFIERLFCMFPLTFTEQNMPYWYKGYESVLFGNIDFDKLFYLMLTTYTSTNVAPAPSWFADSAKACRIKENTAIKEIQQWKEESAKCTGIPEHVKQKMDALKKKLAMGA